MTNVQLLQIHTFSNAEGEVTGRNFTFEFEDGTTSTVGLSGKQLELDLEDQKQLAAKKAIADVAERFKRTEIQNVNETINVY